MDSDCYNLQDFFLLQRTAKPRAPFTAKMTICVKKGIVFMTKSLITSSLIYYLHITAIGIIFICAENKQKSMFLCTVNAQWNKEPKMMITPGMNRAGFFRLFCLTNPAQLSDTDSNFQDQNVRKILRTVTVPESVTPKDIHRRRFFLFS
jgi:hypothetical protein